MPPWGSFLLYALLLVQPSLAMGPDAKARATLHMMAPHSEKMMRQMAEHAPNIEEYLAEREECREEDDDEKRVIGGSSSSRDSSPDRFAEPMLPGEMPYYGGASGGGRTLHVSGMGRCNCEVPHDEGKCESDMAAVKERRKEMSERDDLYFQMTELLRKIEMGHEVGEADMPEELRGSFREALDSGSLYRAIISCKWVLLVLKFLLDPITLSCPNMCICVQRDKPSFGVSKNRCGCVLFSCDISFFTMCCPFVHISRLRVAQPQDTQHAPHLGNMTTCPPYSPWWEIPLVDVESSEGTAHGRLRDIERGGDGEAALPRSDVESTRVLVYNGGRSDGFMWAQDKMECVRLSQRCP